ncbi:GrpB family protein [Microbacterium sp. KSW4-17]|uniref:GrpB family protein n=1 Tax=Microbacterium galbum TaxID=3075994 RepID=A0ABU3T3G5_9MICO|nr:GrpB family protein [Microbacterium sp. KSW4-17]MDU0365896.1 GrpB family protein [Microbacterium sp. KSW4-17]
MPSAARIVAFDDTPPPPGASPWVGEPAQARRIEIVDADATWPLTFATVRDRIHDALGQRAIRVDHVGSTAVPGLAAKPVIDVDLTVADTDDEDAYVPTLEAAGFALRVREPWWLGHRLLVASEPAVHLHVWPPDSPEAARHLIFRDHLRADADDRALYARVKREVAEDGLMSAYNERKQATVRAIYARAFVAAGLISG